MRIGFLVFLALLLFSLVACTGPQATSQPGDGSSSVKTIQNKGSDTMVNLALAWAEQYQKVNPETSISVTGGGSGTGITALANQTVDIANASRAIKSEEEEAIKANGIEPVEFVVARDAIAVIVNPNNPVEKLTLRQISDIYSGKITNWSEVGGEDRPVVRLSRETNSGTHVYFLENVLRLGNTDDKTLFSSETLLLPSSEGITTEVHENPNAIGYDGLGYVTPAVKTIAVAKDSSSSYILPSVESVNNLTYPIARDLYMYTAGQPDENIQAYLEWILSPDGQAIVSELGFVPIQASVSSLVP